LEEGKETKKENKKEKNYYKTPIVKVAK
jgi:hypothetical protein